MNSRTTNLRECATDNRVHSQNNSGAAVNCHADSFDPRVICDVIARVGFISIDNASSIQRFNNGIPKNKVVVISGFGAENTNGEKVLLGKNASDLVAALIGFFDNTVKRVIYLKDVDGIYSDFGTNKQKIIPEINRQDLLNNNFGNVLDKRTLYYQKCDYLVQNENKEFGSNGTIIKNIR